VCCSVLRDYLYQVSALAPCRGQYIPLALVGVCVSRMQLFAQQRRDGILRVAAHRCQWQKSDDIDILLEARLVRCYGVWYRVILRDFGCV
jgi:hypothetical protein